MTKPLIHRRIDAAIADLKAFELQPFVLYLTPPDFEKLCAAASKAWGGPVRALSYSDIPVASAKLAQSRCIAAELPRRSSLYSKCGLHVHVPRKAD